MFFLAAELMIKTCGKMAHTHGNFGCKICASCICASLLVKWTKKPLASEDSINCVMSSFHDESIMNCIKKSCVYFHERLTAGFP